MAWSSPSTVATGDDITAVLWNEQVRDQFLAAGSATSYSPAWTSSGTQPSLGNGTLTGAYFRCGDLITVDVRLTWGTTTSGGTGIWSLSLPFSPLATSFIRAGIQDTGSRFYADFTAVVTPGNPASFTNGPDNVAATVPHTWAATDVLWIFGTYRKA